MAAATPAKKVISAATPDTVSPSESSTPGFQDIATLAYHHWQARGCPDGSPEVDWDRAEQDVRLFLDPASIRSCSTCDLLSEEVLAATTLHIRLGSRLVIASLVRDTARVSQLTPLLEQAGSDRERAVQEYTTHKNGHPNAAQA
jgi:hypothetical protein